MTQKRKPAKEAAKKKAAKTKALVVRKNVAIAPLETFQRDVTVALALAKTIQKRDPSDPTANNLVLLLDELDARTGKREKAYRVKRTKRVWQDA